MGLLQIETAVVTAALAQALILRRTDSGAALQGADELEETIERFDQVDSDDTQVQLLRAICAVLRGAPMPRIGQP